MTDRTSTDTETWRRAAATSVASERAPDAHTVFRRRSEDPTLGDGSKPPTAVSWAPTPTLTDRQAAAAPAYVLVENGARGDTPGARVAEGLEALGRPVERIWPEGGARTSPGPTNHPLVVHVGSDDTVRGSGASDQVAAVAAYQPGATITYAVVTGDGTPVEDVRRRVEALVSRADVVKVTARDLVLLYPGAEPASTVQRWVSSGPAIVVVTGDGGARATNAVGVTAEVAGEDLDGGAAGDAFMAGVIDALWKGGLLGVSARHDLRTLVPGSLQELLDNAAAAASVARTTGRPATREELAAARGVPQLGTA